MMAAIEAFQDHIIEAGVLDPIDVHHEFVSGMHGQKLDFDTITTGSPLYEEWTDTAATFIREEFPELPLVIVGVANGANRIALDTARRFDGAVFGAVSEKDGQNSKVLRLPQATERLIRGTRPELVVVLEDAGTTGSNSVQVARQSLQSGAQNVEVVTTWQRRDILERLQEEDIAYRAIIKEALPTYEAEECQTSGFCSRGWALIPYPQK
jgi:orotate phosphoribosyltransferase